VYKYDCLVRAAVFLDVEDVDCVVVIFVLVDMIASGVVPFFGRDFGHVRA
jgi:hypothetical protein